MNNIGSLKETWTTPLVSPKLIKQFQDNNPYNNYSLFIKSFLYDVEKGLIVDKSKHLQNWIIISEILQSKMN